MFGLGFSEILVILLVALVAMGPKKLPGVAKALGRGLAEFRSAMDEMRTTVYREVQQPLQKAMQDTPALKETSAEYLDRLLAEREKKRAEEEAAQKADAIYSSAESVEASPPADPPNKDGAADSAATDGGATVASAGETDAAGASGAGKTKAEGQEAGAQSAKGGDGVAG